MHYHQYYIVYCRFYQILKKKTKITINVIFYNKKKTKIIDYYTKVHVYRIYYTSCKQQEQPHSISWISRWFFSLLLTS
jgi:hypothetical protein